MSNVLDIPEVRSAALRLTPAQYHKLFEIGGIPERTELLSGIVVEKMPKSPLHTWAVIFLQEWLAKIVTDGIHVRKEDPLTLGDSEPEPDISVVQGTPDDYRLHHPSAAKLVIEVAVSSEAVDRQKAQIYASAAIDEYWIVFPQSKTIEVYRDGLSGHYHSFATCDLAAVIAPRFSPDTPLPIRELFAGG